jgi:hypothetical protein
MGGDDHLYKMITARNRVMYCMLHWRQTRQPPKHWPGSGWLLADDEKIVDYWESICAEAPQRLDTALPHSTGVTAVEVASNFIDLAPIECAMPHPADLLTGASINDFMVSLAELTPTHYAMMLLQEGPTPGAGELQSIQTWRSMLFAAVVLSSPDQCEAQLRLAINRLAHGKWTEDRVHIELEAAKLAMAVLAGRADSFLRDALATALADGSTHNIRHAIEILLILADRAATQGDTALQRRRLKLAARLSTTGGHTRHPDTIRSVITALAKVDASQAARLLEEMRTGAPSAALVLKQALLLIDSGDMEGAHSSLDSLDRLELTLEDQCARLTVELELDLAEGRDCEALERSGGTTPVTVTSLTEHQLLLRGRAFAQRGFIQEATKTWQIGVTQQPNTGECAIELLTFLLEQRNFTACTAINIDYREYPFPVSAMIALRCGIAHLAIRPESDMANDLLYAGCWNIDAEGLATAVRVLDATTLPHLSFVEGRAASAADQWMLGSRSVQPPFENLKVEALEEMRLTKSTKLTVHAIGVSDNIPQLWKDILDGETGRAMLIAEALSEKQPFRSRRRHLYLLELLEHPRLNAIEAAQQRRALCLFAVGALSRTLGEYEDAIRWAESAIEIAQSVAMVDIMRLSQNLLGNSYFDLGEYRLAFHYQWESLGPLAEGKSLADLGETIWNGPETDFQTVLSLINIGNSLRRLGSGSERSARIVAAMAFYRMRNPESIHKAGHKQKAIDALAAWFTPPPPPSPHDSHLDSIVRHLFQHTSINKD